MDLIIALLSIPLGIVIGIAVNRTIKKQQGNKFLAIFASWSFGIATVIFGVVIAASLGEEPAPPGQTDVAAAPEPQQAKGPQPLDFDVLGEVRKQLELLPHNAGSYVQEIGEIEIAAADTSFARLYLVWNRMPKSMLEVETYTNLVAQSLARAMSENLDEGEGWPSVSVHSRMYAEGVTGKDVVRMFGSSHYQQFNDQIRFRPASE